MSTPTKIIDLLLGGVPRKRFSPNSLLLGVLNSFLRRVCPLCRCWCPPCSAGHVAFLFTCLPGLSLLVSALFRWRRSVSFHLSPRSVTAGVRPFPLALQHFYSCVSQVCHWWCPPVSAVPLNSVVLVLLSPLALLLFCCCPLAALARLASAAKGQQQNKRRAQGWPARPQDNRKTRGGQEKDWRRTGGQGWTTGGREKDKRGHRVDQRSQRTTAGQEGWPGQRTTAGKEDTGARGVDAKN